MTKLSLEYITLSDTKNVVLVLISNYDNTKQLASTVVTVDDELITFSHIQTMQFIEELNLFENGNKQNRYFSIELHNSIKNLKLNAKNIYFSKSESRVIYKAYNQTLIGHSLSGLFAQENRLVKIETMKNVFKNRWSDCYNKSNPQY